MQLACLGKITELHTMSQPCSKEPNFLTMAIWIWWVKFKKPGPKNKLYVQKINQSTKSTRTQNMS